MKMSRWMFIGIHLDRTIPEAFDDRHRFIVVKLFHHVKLRLGAIPVDLHPVLAYDQSTLTEFADNLPLLLEKPLSLYNTEPDRQALQIFINWFRQLAVHGRLPQGDFAQIEEQDLTREGVKSMLIKALEREREAIFDSGKKEGIDERNRQIAQAMVANGFPLPTIAQLLDLSVPEVEKLLTA